MSNQVGLRYEDSTEQMVAVQNVVLDESAPDLVAGNRVETKGSRRTGTLGGFHDGEPLVLFDDNPIGRFELEPATNLRTLIDVPPQDESVDDDEADAKIASLHPDIPSPILGLTRPGDLVRQRTGGPAMTVSGAYGTSLSCEWAGEKGIATGRFDLSDLVPASAIDEDGNPVEPPESMIRR